VTRQRCRENAHTLVAEILGEYIVSFIDAHDHAYVHCFEAPLALSPGVVRSGPIERPVQLAARRTRCRDEQSAVTPIGEHEAVRAAEVAFEVDDAGRSTFARDG
jgi:hypothetical protein